MLCILIGAGPARADERAMRIITVGAPVTEIVFALGAGADIVAVDTTSTWPAASETLPKVGYMRNLSAEGIVGLKPDLVIALHAAGPQTTIDQIRMLGVAVEILPSLDHMVALPDAVRHVASLIGRQAEGQSLIAKIDADQAALQALRHVDGGQDGSEDGTSDTGNTPDMAAGADGQGDAHQGDAHQPTITFLMAVGHGQPISAGRDTTADEIIHALGGRNPMAGFDGFKPVSPEIIAADQADYVLLTRSTFDQLGGKAGLLAHPVLGLHRAVAAGRILLISASTILGLGPRSVAEIRDLAVQLARQKDHAHETSQ